MKARWMFLGLGLALATPATHPILAQGGGKKVLVNVNHDGVALDGFDPVAFFTERMPLRGTAKYSAHFGGATYYFATLEHQKVFEANPARFVPQFGGFCAYGASQGHAAPVEISTWQIIKDRLTLNYDKSVQEKFNRDVSGYLAKANANWPALVEKEGKVGE